MAFKIKEGVSIAPYGANYTPFTSESELSQDILAHLAESYPNDIVDESGEKPLEKMTVAELKALLTEKEIVFDEKAIKADLVALATEIK